MSRYSKFTKKDRPSRQRAVRTYLLGLLLCTFLFFLVSLVSFVRQQMLVQDLSSSNLRLGGERIVSALEDKLERLSFDCLRSKKLRNLCYSLSSQLSPAKSREVRERFENLEKEYPFAGHFFVFSDGGLIFPRVKAPVPQTVSSFLSPDGDSSSREFVSLLKAAEARRVSPGQSDEAIELCRRAAALPVTNRMKALALSRAALSVLESRGSAAAADDYQLLLQSYGDQLDLSLVPYTLSMVSLPEPFIDRIFRAYPLAQVYRDLANGRWDLSAERVDHYLDRLENLLGKQKVARPSTDFLDRLMLAKAVQADFPADLPADVDRVTARAVRLDGRIYQTYYAPLAEDSGSNLIIGLSVSMPWVQNKLLPECTEKELGGRSIMASLEEDPGDLRRQDEAGNTFVPFRTVLPHWKLHISTATALPSEAAAHRELWFLGMSSGMFLSILGLGVYLLISVSREIHWFQLQSDFVSGVSHELKTPLSLIRLYSETLADGENEFPPEERKSYVRIIARESERLGHLIDNVLDFSKIQRGQKQAVLSEGDLTATVVRTVEDYSDYLVLRGFTVKTGIQPYLPQVRFNHEQVSQVVLNLMDNARKYSGKSRLIRVHMWRQDADVVLEVQDYGIGISNEEQEKIFEPFYRVTRGNEQGGCGLGLYLVQQVVKDHGGRIEIESTIGKGTRFRLFFPASKSASDRLEAPGGRSFVKSSV